MHVTGWESDSREFDGESIIFVEIKAVCQLQIKLTHLSETWCAFPFMLCAVMVSIYHYTLKINTCSL